MVEYGAHRHLHSTEPATSAPLAPRLSGERRQGDSRSALLPVGVTAGGLWISFSCGGVVIGDVRGSSITMTGPENLRGVCVFGAAGGRIRGGGKGRASSASASRPDVDVPVESDDRLTGLVRIA